MIFTRLYLSQAEHLYRNVTSGEPVAPFYLVHRAVEIGIKVAEDLPAALALAAKFRALGWSVRLFFRLAEGAPFAIWDDDDRWARNAAIVESVRDAGETTVALDAECYSATIGPKQPTIDGLRQGRIDAMSVRLKMRNFIAAISGMDVVYYPAQPGDVVADEIGQATDLTLYTETAMGIPSLPRVDRWQAIITERALTRARTKIEREHRRVGHMVYEDIACEWGCAALADLDMFGPVPPTIFLRDRSDERFIGLASWARGEHQGEANDVRETGVIAGVHRSKLVGGRQMIANALPQLGDFAVAIEVRPGAKFGASQKNHASWQVECADTQARLTVRRGIAYESIVPLTASRIVVGRTAGIWHCNGMMFEHANPAEQAGHLYLDSVVAVADRSVVIHAPGTCLAYEIWHRALTLDEIRAVITSLYPRST